MAVLEAGFRVQPDCQGYTAIPFADQRVVVELVVLAIDCYPCVGVVPLWVAEAVDDRVSHPGIVGELLF